MAIHPSGGRTPRSFALDPSGRFLLVGNQDSDEIAMFRRDEEKGTLEDIGARIRIGTPMCLKFARLGQAPAPPGPDRRTGPSVRLGS